jgi:pimeloyl-ACP methyl ester carboxylesterase
VSESPLPRPPLLFVHGAWHSAWCWDEYFLPWFRARGWDCSAVALRGHGDGAHAGELRWQPAKRTLDDVVAAVEAANRPPVLVGHSLGGYLALRALEEYHLPAAALLAPVPVMGPLPAFMRGLRAEPRAFLGAALALDAGRIVGSPELARRFLYSPAVPEVTVRRTSDRLGAESLRAILDTLLRLPNVAAIRARGTPLLLLAGDADGLFTLDEQRQSAQALGAQFQPVAYGTHNLMLDPQWEHTAGIIESWLQVNLHSEDVKVS